MNEVTGVRRLNRNFGTQQYVFSLSGKQWFVSFQWQSFRECRTLLFQRGLTRCRAAPKRFEIPLLSQALRCFLLFAVTCNFIWDYFKGKDGVLPTEKVTFFRRTVSSDSSGREFSLTLSHLRFPSFGHPLPLWSTWISHGNRYTDYIVTRAFRITYFPVYMGNFRTSLNRRQLIY